MTWTDATWHTFCGLLEEAWPGEFDDLSRDRWRILLDGLDPSAASEGLRQLLLEGRRFRPSVSELLEAARRDPSKPTFEEAYRLIYGHRGVLAARPPRTGNVTLFASEHERQAHTDAAAQERASTLHPLVAAFVNRYGLARLRALPVGDPEWGEKHRRDLRDAWDRHVEAFDGREVAALAAGVPRGELARFDPLAALGIERPQLPDGSPA